MKRHFATLDVFTDTAFAGNPLAVVLEPEGLDTAAMQSIAREFNLSETVFVFPPANRLNRAKLRIFTPARELPFAGHPTVGTAVLLGLKAGSGGASSFVLEEQIGPVPCRTDSRDARCGFAQFDIPRLPSKESGSPPVDAMASALGLQTTDFRHDLPTECWSAGNPFTFVPVRGLDAMARCAVDVARFGEAFGGTGHAAAFVFCHETQAMTSAFHARMFAPGMGVLEDPATGSAVAAFSGYLAAHFGFTESTHIVIEQGYEMGRPSLIHLSLVLANGTLTGASIAGDAVVLMEGTIEA